MSGQRTINLGIKIGTDLQPFVKELERLKGIITSLGTSRQTFNDLAGATMQWSRAVGDLNTKLDQTIQKMGQLGAFPAAMQNLGAVMPQKIQVIAGTAGATGMVAGAPVTPTNTFAAFNKSHRMMLSRAMGLARAVDTTVADINYEPHLIRARNIARFLDERARYSDNAIARARTDVSKLESSYWTQGFISRSAKAGRIVNEDDAEDAHRVQLEHARQQLAGMQLANDSLNKLHDTLSARREMHQSFLQKQGMTGVRLFNAATREDQRREEAVQTTGRRYVRAWRQAHLEDRRRDEAEQREGRTAIRTWNAAYSEDANREAQVQRAGQSQLRIIRMAEAEDQFRSELPQRQGMAQARLLGAAYREDQRRDQAVQRNGMMFTRTWNQAHAENTKREAQVQKEGMANLRVLRMAQEEDSYRNELPTIEGMRQARIVGAAYREKERRETAQQASGMRFERVWTAAHAENLKRSQAPFVARMHAIDATTAENKAQRQMLAGLARLDHQDAMVQARIQREGMQGVRMVNQAYAEDQRRARAPYVAQMQALDAATKEHADERKMEKNLERLEEQEQRKIQMDGVKMLRLRRQATADYRRRLVDPWMQQFNNQFTDTRELMGYIAEERQSGNLTPTMQAKAEARIQALLQQRTDLRAIRGGANVAGYAPLTEKEANQALDKVNAQLKGMNTALKENESGWSSALKSALGFGSAVAGINTMISGLQQMYQAAREVDEAFARMHASVSRLAAPERAVAFKAISSGAMEDMLRTGMSLTDTAKINTAVYLGSSGDSAEKRSLARTITNLQFSGGVNSEETLGMVPAFANAGFSAGETRAFFERSNVLQGTLNLDQHRMRAFMVATAAGLPALGSTQSWEDTQAWALQEAAASRDMVMGSKLNRIQIALQNPRTLRRLNEIIGKRGERTEVGGMDIESMLNSGNPMQTIGKLQTLYEQGHLNDAEITKVGQTLDMWNSPGTIQVLKGGLEPYRRKLREADVLSRAGLNSTDEAAGLQAQSLGASMDRLGASFKALFSEMNPVSGAIRGTVNALTGLVSAIAANGGVIKAVTAALMVVLSTITISKGLQGAGSLVSTIKGMRGAGTMGEWLGLGAGALGGVASLGVGLAVTGAVAGLNAWEGKVNANAEARSERTRVESTDRALSINTHYDEFFRASDAAARYKDLVNEGRGATEEALRLKRDLIALLPKQLNGETTTLNILRGQTAELDEQIRRKAVLVKDELRGQRGSNARMLSVGLHYEADDLMSYNQAMRAVQPAISAGLLDNDEEVRRWATEAQKTWGAATGKSYVEKAYTAMTLMDNHRLLLGRLSGGVYLGRNSATANLMHTLARGAGVPFNEQEWHWYKPNGMSKYWESITGAWKNLYSVDAKMRVVDYTDDPSDEKFLRGLAAEVGAGNVSEDEAAIHVSSRMRKIKGDKAKQEFRTLGDRIAGELRSKGVSEVKKMHARVGIYHTDIGSQAEELASNKGHRADLTQEARTWLNQSDAVSGMFRKADPAEAAGGGKLDTDRGKDPFTLYRKFEQRAKSATQTNDLGALMDVLSDPEFNAKDITKEFDKQIKKLTQDDTINMASNMRRFNLQNLRAGRMQVLQFVGKQSQRKMLGSVIDGILKSGYEDETGQVIIKGDAELYDEAEEAVLNQFGGNRPTDENDRMLFDLMINEYVAKARKSSMDDGSAEAAMLGLMSRGDSKRKELGKRLLDGHLPKIKVSYDRSATSSAKATILHRVGDIQNTGYASLNSQRMAAGVRGMFGNEYQQQQDLYDLTMAEIRIKQDMLKEMGTEASLKKERLALEQQIMELTLKQYGSMEQVQRVMANQKEGRAFSQAVIGELFAGDAKDRLPKLGNMMLTSVNRGVASQMNRVMDQMDNTGALGGIGNPLAALGRALYDPSGEMEGKDIQRALLDTTRLQVQATQANTAAVQANTAARSGQTPPTTPSGGGAGPAIPTPGGAGATNAMTQGGMPVYNVTGGAPVAEGLVGGADQGSAWAPWEAAGAGALGGMGLGSLIGGDRASGAVGAGLGAGMGMFMYYGAKGNRNAGRVATLNTSNGPLMVRQGRLGAGEAQKITKESGMSGDGTAYFYSQLGMTTPGVNWFSKENITGYMEDGSPANITGGLWKTDEYGRATGEVNWTSAAAGAANIGMSAYAGYMSQRGNGQAAQNWQLLSSGLGAASSMTGGATLFGGAAVAMASTVVLAIAAIAASVMAGVAAAEHQADEQNKAYREKEAEMMRLLAIAEEQRRSVGAAAERILSARADVNEVFSGVAASAFLSGRYSQTAPTIHVDNLVVQANNPAELSAALAQGVAREIRRGA